MHGHWVHMTVMCIMHNYCPWPCWPGDAVYSLVTGRCCLLQSSEYLQHFAAFLHTRHSPITSGQ